MRKKDMVYLVAAAAIFLVAGYIAYTQLVPQGKSGSGGGVEVEKVGRIPATLDGMAGLEMIKDSTKVQDFNSPVDLTGLGNKAPFGS